MFVMARTRVIDSVAIADSLACLAGAILKGR